MIGAGIGNSGGGSGVVQGSSSGVNGGVGVGGGVGGGTLGKRELNMRLPHNATAFAFLVSVPLSRKETFHGDLATRLMAGATINELKPALGPLDENGVAVAVGKVHKMRQAARKRRAAAAAADGGDGSGEMYHENVKPEAGKLMTIDDRKSLGALGVSGGRLMWNAGGWPVGMFSVLPFARGAATPEESVPAAAKVLTLPKKGEKKRKRRGVSYGALLRLPWHYGGAAGPMGGMMRLDGTETEEDRRRESGDEESENGREGRKSHEDDRRADMKDRRARARARDRKKDRTYDPNWLDDPDLRTGKNKRVIRLPGMISSTVPYVRESTLRLELNEQWANSHPELAVSMSLTKIRAMKRALLDIAQAGASGDICMSTVALAFVYLEKLVCKGAVVKANRKRVAAACLVLAHKYNDPVEAIMPEGLLPTVQSRLGVTPSEVLATEFGVFVSLAFNLHVPESEVIAHLRRISEEVALEPSEQAQLAAWSAPRLRRTGIDSDDEDMDVDDDDELDDDEDDDDEDDDLDDFDDEDDDEEVDFSDEEPVDDVFLIRDPLTQQLPYQSIIR